MSLNNNTTIPSLHSMRENVILLNHTSITSRYSVHSTLSAYNSALSNGSVTASYERPFSDSTIWISCAIIFCFFVIGFTLNLLTLLVIIRYPQLRNFFGIFIMSLCISDLISAIISPLFWYRRTLGFEEWELPDFFCRFFWGADIMTSFSTALHITTFGLLRYFSIKFPFCHHKMTERVAKILIVSIWIVTFCCGFVPFFIWFGSRERHRYDHKPESRWPSCTINIEWYTHYTLFQKIVYPLLIYVPSVIMIATSIMTSVEVDKSTRSVPAKSSIGRRRKDKQAVLQLALIVISFLIGYIPFTAYEFWSVREHENTPHLRRLDYHLGLSQYFLIRFSECLNPIFYNLGSSRMRRCTRSYCRVLLGKKDDVRRQSITALCDFGRTINNNYKHAHPYALKRQYGSQHFKDRRSPNHKPRPLRAMSVPALKIGNCDCDT